LLRKAGSASKVTEDLSLENKAHDVRALASSWALFNNASLNEVLSAGFWRGESSFVSHYLRSMSVHEQRSETPFLIGIKSLLLVLECKEAVLVK
jgi:hypothetical protein